MKNFYIYISTFILLLMSHSAFALQVNKIDVRYNSVYSSDIVKKYSLKEGEVFSYDDLGDSIIQIYENLDVFFVDASIDAVNIKNIDFSADTAVDITYYVYDNPRLNSISFEGNKVFSDRSLLGTSKLKYVDILKKQNLSYALTAIKSKYSKKGLPETTIIPEMNFLINNSLDINFQVNEGGKKFVYNIDFNGNTNFSDEQLKQGLAIKEKTFWSFITRTGLYDFRSLLVSQQSISSLYQNNGYLDIQVSNGHVDNPTWVNSTIIYNLIEGDKYYIGEIEVLHSNSISLDNYISKPEINEIIEDHDLLKNEVANKSHIDLVQSDIRRVLQSRGYKDVRVTQETRKYKVNGKSFLDIRYSITPNKRYTIYKINLIAEGKTYDYVLRREFEIYEGDILNMSAINKGVRKLLSLGVFTNISIDYADPASYVSEKGVNYTDVNITIEEPNQGNFNFGITGSPAGKSIGFYGIFKKRNLLGRGYNMDLSALFGSNSQSYNLTFSNPRVFNSEVGLDITLYDNVSRNQLSEGGYDYHKRGAALGLSKRLSDIISVSASFSRSDKTVERVLDNSSELIKNAAGTTVEKQLVLGASRNGYNNYVSPTSGSKQIIEYFYTGGLFGGDENYQEIKFTNTFHVPLLEERFIYSNKFQYSSIFKLGEEEIPVAALYHIGGRGSIRGYKSLSIGYMLDNGSVVGSDQYFYNQNQISYPLGGVGSTVSIFTFLDVGQVLVDLDYLTEHGVEGAVGVGLNMQTALGLLEFSYGYKLRPYAQDSEMGVFDFGVGNLF